MPQMAPMNWLSLFIFFFLMFIIFNMMNYFFFFTNKPMLKFSFMKNKKLLNWKW
uniref:ATP synthase F0 subunit 8 n=1 Tax=Thelaira chrysopruinosa TaxID=3061172 RepID=UPI00286A84C8|nr:ATP synthase F0 subunit 8 [Thelaira chrysopruinosa]WKF19262.1 ATP synthase F0 subunit 8 [Thelaira chrysopruinosa]